MCEHIIRLGKSQTEKDTFDTVLADWIIIGQYLAFRLQEYVQETQSRIELNNKAKGGDGSPKAFTFYDILNKLDLARTMLSNVLVN